jgi:hypothetical protein
LQRDIELALRHRSRALTQIIGTGSARVPVLLLEQPEVCGAVFSFEQTLHA